MAVTEGHELPGKWKVSEADDWAKADAGGSGDGLVWVRA